MGKILKSTILLISILASSGNLKAQTDTAYTFCNLFYLSSDHPEILPFENYCFVNDNFDILNYKRMRVVGPIHDQMDLFKDYDFSFTFFLPDVSGDTRLIVEQPKDILSPEHKIAPGNFFFTISDNRIRRIYGPGGDEVDFATISGKVKVLEFTPVNALANHPQFLVQFDVNIMQVDRSSGKAVYTGQPIRLKGSLKVEKVRIN